MAVWGNEGKLSGFIQNKNKMVAFGIWRLFCNNNQMTPVCRFLPMKHVQKVEGIRVPYIGECLTDNGSQVYKKG